MAMSVKEIEEAIIKLPKDQKRKFRAWYEKYDSESWDEQIEQDVVAGKLDALAKSAIADHIAGKSKEL